MATAGSSSGGGGGGGVPPGFRFHPTDEELLHFYLKKKISFHKFDMDVIREVDLNKIEPWELQERCRIGSTPQNEWYFFSHKDRKYPTGSRTNRATGAGFWKATGRDKCIRNSFSKIGMRKTLVFYRGRAPHGLKTDWIMHEYRLHDDDDEDDHDHSIPAANTNNNNNNNNNSSHNNDHPQHHQEDGWVVCRVFKKKNLFKAAGNSSGGGGGGHVTTNGNINQCDDHQQLTSSSRSLFTTIRDNNNASIINQYNLLHHPDLNYTITHHDDHHNHHIPLLPPPVHHHQYPHLIEAQNLIISPDENNQMIKPLMLSTSSTNNDNNNYHHQHHHHNFLADHQTVMMTSSMQVKQFMSSNTNTREDCESASPTPAAADYQACDQSRNPIADDRGDQNMNEWDRLVVATSHHDQQASNATSSINQINPLSLPSEMDFWAYGK